NERGKRIGRIGRMNNEPQNQTPAVVTSPAATSPANSATAKTAAAPTPAAPAPAPTPPPNPLAHLPLPFQGVDYSLRGFHAEATVAPDQVVSAAELLNKEGFALDTITGVDWMASQQMEVVYDYFHPDRFLRAVIRARIPRDNPEIRTVSKVF